MRKWPTRLSLSLALIALVEFGSRAAFGEQQHQQVSSSQQVAGSFGLADFLMMGQTDELLDESSDVDRTLAELLDRDGVDMRPMRDFRDSDQVTLRVAKRAWSLMHHHARSSIDERVTRLWPHLEKLLKTAQVSSKCLNATHQTALAAHRFDSWAIQSK